MDVILTADVASVGRRNEVKKVASGYATNFLFPRKLAIPATQNRVKRLRQDEQKRVDEQEVRDTLLEKSLETIRGKTFTLEVKANDKGHLFEGVHQADIIRLLKEQQGVELQEENILLEKPLKEAGMVSIAVKVGEAEAAFALDVRGIT